MTNCFRHPGFQQFRNRSVGTARLEVSRLVPKALIGREENAQLFGRFHAFRYDSQIQISSHADNRGHYGRLVGSGGDLANK